MLESVKRAYDKGAFDTENDELKCPADLKTVELYLQILRPCYFASIYWQTNHSSIADTVPCVLQLIHEYQMMDVPSSYQKLCKGLVKCIKQKFDYELKSNEYLVCKIL